MPVPVRVCVREKEVVGGDRILEGSILLCLCQCVCEIEREMGGGDRKGAYSRALWECLCLCLCVCA